MRSLSLGTSVSKRHSSRDGECLLWCLAERTTGTGASGSVFTQAEKQSRMDETSSSQPDKISSSGCRKDNRLGKMPHCFGRLKLRTRVFGGSRAPKGSQKYCAFLCFQIFVGAFVSPKGCLVDCGREVRSRGAGSSRVALHPSSFTVWRLSDVIVLGTEHVAVLGFFTANVALVVVYLFSFL